MCGRVGSKHYPLLEGLPGMHTFTICASNSGENGMMKMISGGHNAFPLVFLKARAQTKKLLADDALPASE